MTTLKIVAAVLIGISLIGSSWLWHRVRRTTGDATVFVPMIVLCASSLAGLLSGLAFPTNEKVQIAISGVNIVVALAVIMVSIRRAWRLGGAAK
jgi:hypothetical protein